MICPYGDQRKLIAKYCFNKCDKILFGALEGEYISGYSCDEQKCPYEEKSMKYGKISDGKVVWVRKLKEIK